MCGINYLGIIIFLFIVNLILFVYRSENVKYDLKNLYIEYNFFRFVFL